MLKQRYFCSKSLIVTRKKNELELPIRFKKNKTILHQILSNDSNKNSVNFSDKSASIFLQNSSHKIFYFSYPIKEKKQAHLSHRFSASNDGRDSRVIMYSVSRSYFHSLI